MTQIYLPPSFLSEAQPIFDDAFEAYTSSDPYLRQMAPIVDKIRAAQADKHGYVTIDVTAEEAATLATEGTYRGEALWERSADAYSNSERMSFLGASRGVLRRRPASPEDR